MKKRISFLIALGAVMVLYGCASRELQLKLSGFRMLKQTELEQLFYAERTAEFSSPNGNATVMYFPDGRQEITWGSSGNDQGTFRIKDDQFCSTWTRLRNGAESCSTIYQVSGTEYEFISGDGTSAAVMRLK